MKTNRALPEQSSTYSRPWLGAVIMTFIAGCGGGTSGTTDAPAPAAAAPPPTMPASVPVAPLPTLAATETMQPLAPVSLAISAGVQTLATSNVLAFAIEADGSLWAWGAGTMGEFGDGERISRSPSPIRIGEGFKAVATGSMQNTIAVKADGTLWAWGQTHAYELGTGPQNYLPVQIGTGFIAVSAGMDNYAIKADGTLWAWGRVNGNREGALGDGTTVDRLVPVQIGVDFASVSANAGGGGVGVKRDGSLWRGGRIASGWWAMAPQLPASRLFRSVPDSLRRRPVAITSPHSSQTAHCGLGATEDMASSEIIQPGT